MKKTSLNIIEWWLSILASSKIKKANPKIITVTGSYGKTSTKEAIYFILSKKFGSDCGKNWGNMNSVIGLPLAVLGLKRYSFGMPFFLDLFRAFWGYLFYHLPKVLVLELGIDKPGEMEKLLKIVNPDIGVLTGIAETHLEELKNIEGVRSEKSMMISAIKTGGFFIVNGDDPNCSDIKPPKGVETIKYGRNSDVSYSDLVINVFGNHFNLKADKEIKPVQSKLIGQHSVNILLSATAVALKIGLRLPEIAESLKQIRPQKGRMNPIKLKNQMVLIDDSYNSNPKSAIEALKTLLAIKWDGRKVAILGNMNELGEYTKQGHLIVGEEAGKIVNLFLVAGPNVGIFSKGAKKYGMDENNIFCYPDPEKLILDLKNRLKPKDLILVKASQSKMRFERVVKFLIDDEEISKNILVRQEKKWQKIV
jgi:UDP-N-acetylmuramoyl-tripeptide--D-alanyl-D-alanine ligase